MLVARPLASSETSFPVMAAICSPFCPCPNANSTLEWRGERPITGNVSGVCGRGADPKARAVRVQARKELAGLADDAFGVNVVGGRVRVRELGDARDPYAVLHRTDDDVAVGERDPQPER